MRQTEKTNHPLRKPLLTLEFGSLAILLISMAYFSSSANEGASLSPAWLLIPALASLAVFCSFIGLMYLRWVAAAEAGEKTRHKIIFSLLAVTLLGVWGYGIVNTWISLTA
ncbi:MAG: hypothetical protein ACQEV6_07650 [Pseudomonadota bacterium]